MGTSPTLAIQGDDLGYNTAKGHSNLQERPTLCGAAITSYKRGINPLLRSECFKGSTGILSVCSI